MNNIVEDAIEQSWRDFSEVTPTFFMGSPSVCRKAHDHGWKEGYEWALTELEIDKKNTQRRS